jgi:3-oxoacyl-[acyl-carrier protein] reductase
MAVGIDLDGQVAVVTGSLGGIGTEIIAVLNEAGATCVGLDMPEKEGEEHYFPVDITDEAGVESVFALITDQYGGVDILVNCAGITRDNWLLKMTAEQFDQVVAVNQRGTFLCMREAGKAMKAQGPERGGRIVNISSIAREGNRGQVNYAGTKAAVSSMAAVAAEELGGFGIRVNAVAPGPVETEMLKTVPEDTRNMMVMMSALGKLAQPRDIANVVLFLVSDLASHITGETVTVSGGLHLP